MISMDTLILDNTVHDITTTGHMVQLLNSHGRSKSDYKVGMVIQVDNKMQTNYTYTLTAPIGKKFDPMFMPELTPKQMLELGVFEGKYCNDQILEFPKEWYYKALKTNKLSPAKANIDCNATKVKSRLSLKFWRDKGWIYGDDPRGWFEWYCRYFLGRRDPLIDRKQIMRWRGVTRHISLMQKACPVKGDLTCRPKQRQLLYNWAYDAKKY